MDFVHLGDFMKPGFSVSVYKKKGTKTVIHITLALRFLYKYEQKKHGTYHGISLKKFWVIKKDLSLFTDKFWAKNNEK